jgi:hypothetical protein
MPKNGLFSLPRGQTGSAQAKKGTEKVIFKGIFGCLTLYSKR